MSKKSLLEQAKIIHSKNNPKVKIDADRIALAIAWLKSEVSTKQCSLVLGYKETSGNVLYTIASNLKIAFSNGLIKVVKK